MEDCNNPLLLLKNAAFMNKRDKKHSDSGVNALTELKCVTADKHDKRERTCKLQLVV